MVRVDGLTVPVLVSAGWMLPSSRRPIKIAVQPEASGVWGVPGGPAAPGLSDPAA
jgi:hypothetical protein